ncbi:hypothetical protein DMC14_001390 [Metamycoplasma phocicerebrale]|uniref:Uncharacterized protein n=1 Tax=Metamycoplasma phocicerebrale TaxID=142649 RepID=A0A3T0TTP4_9BACT|nr:hypothetical protein [Metamycoplasma phocicerebrale]AZZ65440.1 hypothetical protein DMC14_001390 [Metamycoplasma phocicerebrale]
MKKILFLGSALVSVPFTIVSAKIEKNNEIDISLTQKNALNDYKNIIRNKDVKIKFTKYLDVDKKLRSLLVVYVNKGYSIISLANGKIIEVNPLSKKYLNFNKEVNDSQVFVTKELFSHGMNYAINDKSRSNMSQNKFFKYDNKFIDGWDFEQILKRKGIIS